MTGVLYFGFVPICGTRLAPFVGPQFYTYKTDCGYGALRCRYVDLSDVCRTSRYNGNGHIM